MSIMRFPRRVNPLLPILWLSASFNTLRRDFSTWSSIILTYSLISLLIFTIPIIGVIVLAVLTPFLSVGIIHAFTSRVFVHKLPTMKKIFLVYGVKDNFVKLGVIYYLFFGTLFVFALVFLTSLLLPQDLGRGLEELNDLSAIGKLILSNYSLLGFGSQIQVILVLFLSALLMMIFHLVGILSAIYYYFYEKGILFAIRTSVEAMWKNLLSFIFLSAFILIVYLILFFLHQEFVYSFSNYSAGISVIFLFFGRAVEVFLTIVCVFVYFSIFGFENEIAELQPLQIS